MFNNMSLKENSILTPKEDIISRENDDGTVIIMRMNSENLFFKVNGVAAEIWSSFKTEQSLKEIIQNLSTKYNVPKEQIIKDAENYLKEIIRLDLVTIH